MTERNWLDRIVLFDCEVFQHDWLVCFESYRTGAKYHVHNDPNKLRAFFQKYDDIILTGYNNKSYDNYILRAILCDFEPEQVKVVNDWIIAEDQPGWTFNFPYRITLPASTDLMLDVVPPKGLKEIEGNLGMNIVECSIDFTIDHRLSQSEFDEVLRYCEHDVTALRPLFEARKGYLQSKVNVGEMSGLTTEKSIYMTNAQLTGAFLQAEKVARYDEREYVFPKELNLDKIPDDVKSFFHQLYDEEIDSQYLFKSKLETTIAGVPTVVGWGGLHGALPCHHENSTDERVILNADVGSYYPTLMIQYGYASRNIPSFDVYKDTYHRRLEAKHSGDNVTADSLKLVLNTNYGAMLNEFSELYDPLHARSVCISGQLFLIELAVSLNSLRSLKFIQFNTDGIMFSIDCKQRHLAEAIVNEWEERTRFTMEYDEVKVIAQKDVNNYVMLDGSDKIKFKGGYVSDFKGGSFKSKNMPIVCKAIVQNLLYNVPVEETIHQCEDATLFQQIAKAGRTYHKSVQDIEGELVNIQRVNRIYATSDTRYGMLYKVKLDAEGTIVRKDKIANCPNHCLIDNENIITVDQIDKQFYIDIANKRINDFKGIKTKKVKKASESK